MDQLRVLYHHHGTGLLTTCTLNLIHTPWPLPAAEPTRSLTENKDTNSDVEELLDWTQQLDADKIDSV